MNIRPFTVYCNIPFTLLLFCPIVFFFWRGSGGTATCWWEVTLVAMLQGPMTSFMSVMSQLSVSFIFYGNFSFYIDYFNAMALSWLYCGGSK